MLTPFDFLNAVSALEKPEGVIAFPTDTVYGLGCLPKHPGAIRKIYTLKGRTETKPLVLMSNDAEAFAPFLGEMTLLQAKRYKELAREYWPGALTMVVPKSSEVSKEMTQGVMTVGLRVPDCPFLSVLFQMIYKGVLATTSANVSNQPELATGDAVEKAFGTQLDFLLKQDGLGSGEASTVVAIEADGGIRVLREGRIVLD